MVTNDATSEDENDVARCKRAPADESLSRWRWVVEKELEIKLLTIVKNGNSK